MSTILDSLKKSSNNRDSQEKLSLDNFNFGQSKRHSKSGIIMILLLMIVVAITLAYGYRYINSHDNESSKETNVKTETSVIAENQNDLTEATKIQKPNSEQVRKQLSETKQKNQQLVNEITDESISKDDEIADGEVNNPVEVKNSDSHDPRDKTDNMTQNSRSRNQSDQLDQKLIDSPIVEIKLPEEKNKPQNHQNNPVVATQEYMYVYQLPFSVRKELPKFILNIHIFDENPENRVAVINGTKFAVNDLIEEQVLIKDIVREGVLLEFNNHQFLIPIL